MGNCTPTMSVITSKVVNSSSDKTQIHLPYLEGLWGVTALFVLFHHCFHDLSLRVRAQPTPPLLSKLLIVFNYGHNDVDVFIVLSGYCLVLCQAFTYTIPNRVQQAAWDG